MLKGNCKCCHRHDGDSGYTTCKGCRARWRKAYRKRKARRVMTWAYLKETSKVQGA